MPLRLCLFEYFSNYSLDYVKRITYLSWGGGPKVWRIPVLFWTGIPTPLVVGVGAKYAHMTLHDL